MTSRNVMGIDELWATVGGSFAFTLDNLVNMASESEVCGEDGLLIHHRDETYFIPKSNISEYFTTHPRPGKRMTREDERAALLKKIAELEQINARLQQAQVAPATAKPAFVSESAVDGTETSSGEIETDAPLFEQPAITLKPQPMDDIKRELERDLKGKQPIRSKKE